MAADSPIVISWLIVVIGTIHSCLAFAMENSTAVWCCQTVESQRRLGSDLGH